MSYAEGVTAASTRKLIDHKNLPNKFNHRTLLTDADGGSVVANQIHSLSPPQ